MKRKASYLKIFLLGFGFFGISVLWALYNSDVPIMLKDVYGLSYTASGWVMNIDNILAITLIPLVGFWSDHIWTRIGRRMPFIVFGTAADRLRTPPASITNESSMRMPMPSYFLTAG